ncbi:DegT/DnrJ/EryC1/StrS family aminotransferase [Phascolarctobacterium faecium]|uniref:DegT/DnrJ/EryC1/StrS family aminotransferase n=1 Tax=Phascolarctobacterium faecium TaxID=33025 RepID=UPI0035204FB7
MPVIVERHLLHVALEALKEKYSWDQNSEVLGPPAITFIATSNAVMHAGMKPVFVDVDSRTYNIDTKLIEEKITENTVAIIASAYIWATL